MPEPTRLPKRGKHLRPDERYYERGLLQYEKGKYEQAVADLDEAIHLKSNKAEYFAARGLILLQAGRTADAELDLAYALKLDRKQWLAHYARGMLAFQEGDFNSAKNHFSRAQPLAPERPEIYYYRAITLHLLDNDDEAARDMEFAIDHFEAADKRHRLAQKWLSFFKKS